MSLTSKSCKPLYFWLALFTSPSTIKPLVNLRLFLTTRSPSFFSSPEQARAINHLLFQIEGQKFLSEEEHNLFVVCHNISVGKSTL